MNLTMKKMKSAIGAAIVLVAVVAIMASFLAIDYHYNATRRPGPIGGATNSESNGLNQIVVDGVGTISIDPDQAVVSLGVMTQAETATQAIQDNAAKMSQVVDTLKAMGISEDDIRTSRFSLWTVYDEDRTVPVGFRVNNLVTVTTKEIEQVGQLIDTAVLAGANQILSVSFSLSEEAIAQVRFQALDLAIEDAQARANAIANKLDLKIVGVGHVSESTVFYRPLYAETAAMDFRGATPIEPGQVDFTVTIHIVFLFE